MFVPIEKGMVDKSAMKKELQAGMELFVDEVVDFLKIYIPDIDPKDFFDKLIYDSDVQMPTLVVMINQEMKEDIVFKAYDSLRAAVTNKLEKKG